MKKLFLKITAVLTLAAAMFTMTACGDKKDDKSENDTQTAMQARWAEEFSSFDDCKSYALTSYVYTDGKCKNDEAVNIDYVIRLTHYYDVKNNVALLDDDLAIKILTSGYSLTDIDLYENSEVSITPEINKYFFDGEWYHLNPDPIYLVEDGEKCYSVTYDSKQQKYVGKLTESADFGELNLNMLSLYKMLGGMYEYVESLGEFKPKESSAYLENIAISFPESGKIKIDILDEDGAIITSTVYHSVNDVTIKVPEYTIVEESETPATDGVTPKTDNETPATDGDGAAA